MFRALSILLLAGGILYADDVADRKAINEMIGSLVYPQIRSDPKMMAALIAMDFDGNLDLIPARTVWCETSCEGVTVRSLQFLTTDVVLAGGETTIGFGIGTLPISRWVMIVKREATGWRISSIRSSNP